MNRGTAIVGGIIMVIGFVLFMIGYSLTQDPLLRIGLIPERYAIAWIWTWGGGGIAVGGLASFIYGIASHDEEYDDEDFRFCPHCGKEIPIDEFKFCPHCGASLDGSTTTNDDAKKEEIALKGDSRTP